MGVVQARKGLTDKTAFDIEAGVVDGSVRGPGFRNFYSARAGLKYAPQIPRQFVGVGFGLGTAVGDELRTAFASADAGFYAGFDNDYLIPWFHAYGFYSAPLVQRQVEWRSSDCSGGFSSDEDERVPCLNKIRARRSLGVGWSAGVAVSVGRMGPNTPPLRFTIGAGDERIFPLDVASIQEGAAPAEEWIGVRRLSFSFGLSVTL